jgi:hypothetical protein
MKETFRVNALYCDINDINGVYMRVGRNNYLRLYALEYDYTIIEKIYSSIYAIIFEN